MKNKLNGHKPNGRTWQGATILVNDSATPEAKSIGVLDVLLILLGCFCVGYFVALLMSAAAGVL